MADCTENRVLDFSDVADKLPEEAWEALIEADKTRDLDDIRDVGLDDKCHEPRLTLGYRRSRCMSKLSPTPPMCNSRLVFAHKTLGRISLQVYVSLP